MPTIWLGISSRIISGLGKGMGRASRASALSTSVTQENYGKAFGIHQGIDTSGSIVGLGLILATIHTISYHQAFIWAFVPMLLATCVIMYGMHDPFTNTTTSETFSNISDVSIFAALPTRFWYFISIMDIFSLVQISASSVLLRNYEISGGIIKRFTDYYAVALYITYAIARTISGYIAGISSRSLDPIYILAIGFFTFTCATFSMLLDITVPAFGFPLFLLFGISNIVITTMELAIIPHLLAETLRDAGYGILYVCRGFGMLISSWTIGWIWSTYSAYAAFMYICTLSVLSIGVLI